MRHLTLLMWGLLAILLGGLLGWPMLADDTEKPPEPPKPLTLSESTKVTEPPKSKDGGTEKPAAETLAAPSTERPADLVLFEAALLHMQDGMLLSARAEFDRLLRDYPDSTRTASAMFHLASILYVQSDVEGAKKIYTNLLERFPTSPYSTLALCTVLPPDTIVDLGDKFRKQAETDQNAADHARKLYTHYRETFPRGKRYTEVLFKLGDYAAVREDSPKSDFAKLAAIIEGGETAFRNQMDAIFALNSEDEQFRILIELSDRFAATLAPNDQVRCLYWRAHALKGLHRLDEAIEQFQSLHQKHPQSSLAPAMAFWQGECQFRNRRRVEAKATWLLLAKQHPKSELGVLAREFADGVDDTERSWDKLTALVQAAFGRLATKQWAVAFDGEVYFSGTKTTAKVRFAAQNPRRLLVAVDADDRGFQLGCNAKDLWMLCSERKTLYQARQKGIDLPFPSMTSHRERDFVETSDVRASSSSSFADFWDTLNLDEGLPIPPPGQAFLDDVKKNWHINRIARLDERGQPSIAYRIQEAKPNGRGCFCELVFDASEHLRSVRFDWPVGDVVWRGNLRNIRIAEPIPDSVFDMPQIPGYRTVTIEKLHVIDILADLLRVTTPFAKGLFED